MESLGQVNSMWGFAALALYLIVECIKWIINSRNNKNNQFATQQSLDELKGKFDKHVDELHSEISAKLQGIQVLQLLQKYAYNCSNDNAVIVRSAAYKYLDSGHNGEVSTEYHKWEAKREEMLSNLKNSNNNNE